MAKKLRSWQRCFAPAMRGSMRSLTLLLATVVALAGSASATCPDFAAWLRPENQVNLPLARCARASVTPVSLAAP